MTVEHTIHAAAIQGDAKAVSDFLAKGADIEAKGGDWRDASPLSVAAAFGRLEVVKLLVERKASLEAKGYKGLTPLMWAAEYGHTEVIGYLLDQGADIEARDAEQRTAVLIAAFWHRGAAAKFLLKRGAKADVADGDGTTLFSIAKRYCEDLVPELEGLDLPDLLLDAAVRGDLEAVKKMIGRGMDVNTKGANNRAALMMASLRGHTEVVSWLLANGADPAAKDSRGLTPLLAAACQGQKGAIEILLDSGRVDINEADDDGDTPLLNCLDNVEAFSLLLKKGADVRKKNKRGADALVAVLTKGEDDGRAEFLAALKEAGFEPTAEDLALAEKRRASNELWEICSGDKDDTEAARAAIAKSADIELALGNANTPLEMAAIRGHINLIKMLVEEFKANIGHLDGDDDGVMAMALSRGHLEVARYLLSKGADPRQKNKEGKSVYSYAKDDCPEFVKDLEAIGVTE